MITYLITILIVFLLSLGLQRHFRIDKVNNQSHVIPNKLFVIMISTVLITVAGLRWKVGTDYWQYASNYKKYVDEVWSSLFSYSEPGINLIAWLSSIIYDDNSTMFFLASLITIGLSVSTISKYSKMFTFSILLYIFIGAWHGSFNGIRQYLACAVIFAGHRYIIKEAFMKYLMIVLLAGLFHLSALGMIILYFVPKKRLNIKALIILIVMTITFIVSSEYIFEVIESIKESSIASSDYAQRQVNYFRILIAFAPILFFYTLTNKNKLTSEDFFYINMLYINFILVLSTSQSAYLARIVIFTSIFMVLGIPRLINMNDKYLKFLIQSTIIILYALFWYIEVAQTPNLVNFKWIFERS